MDDKCWMEWWLVLGRCVLVVAVEREEIIVILYNSKAFQVMVGNTKGEGDKISTFAQKLLPTYALLW